MALMNRKIRLLLWASGGLVLAVIALLLLLPALVDVNRFHAEIEERVEAALGRDVDLGTLRLTVFPRLAVEVSDIKIGALPGESRDHLLTAARLRVGARLMPLLGKRLEVTSIVLEEPSLVLERNAQGVWNVQQLTASADPGEPDTERPSSDSGFSFDQLRITGGTILVREEIAGAEAREVTLSDLDLTISGLLADGEVDLQLSAALSLGADCRIRLRGTARPVPDSQDLQIAAQLEIDDLPADQVAVWAESLGGMTLPAGMLGERLLSARASMEASFTGTDTGTALASAHVEALSLEGLDLTVRRAADGGWDLFKLLGDEEGQGEESSAPPPKVTLNGIELENTRVRFVDESGSVPVDVLLDPLSLHLDHLPTEGPATLELTTRIEVADGEGMLSLGGTFGPVGDGSFPLDASLELEQIPLAAAAPFLSDYLELQEGQSGALDLSLHAVGVTSETLELSGVLELHGVKGSLVGVDNHRHDVSLDPRLDYEVRVDRGGETLELRRFDVALAGNELRFRGKLDRSDAVTVGTISLLPTSFDVEDLVGLLSIAGVELPFSMSGTSPMKIELQVEGPLGGDAYPDVNGRLEVAGLTLRHPSMEKPLEAIQGVVAIHGQTVQVTGFSARMGGSDLAGNLSVEGFETPHVRFALRSDRADFWELASFVSGLPEDSVTADDMEASGGVPPGVVADGTLRIEQGSFQALRFRDLDAGLKFEGQQLSLAPLVMKLYDGSFSGSASLDLASAAPSFQLHSDVKRLDLDPLLTENLDSPGLLFGRFSGVFDVAGSGMNYEAIVASLVGGGQVEILEGAVGKLDVLAVLSKASDIFGEQTLATLSRKFAEEGTEFSRLTATLTLGKGHMVSQDLLLESPDLNLEGEADINLLESTLEGDFQVVFSDDLSRSMENEGSRAAQIFWDPGIDRVSLPLGLAGPFEAPTPAIDWGTAAKRVATRKVQDKVRDKLAGLLGGRQEEKKETPSEEPVSAEGSSKQLVESQAPQPAVSEESAAAASPGGLQATITSTDWGGSFLAKDLHIKGTVEGNNLARISLTLTDARGNRLKRIDKLGAIDRYFSNSETDRSQRNIIPWSASVDGKRLLFGSPFTIQIELTTTDHQTATSTRDVKK